MTNQATGLLPAQIERLALVAEEAGEVIQAIQKILRHGFESSNPELPLEQRVTNRQHLEKELGQLHLVMGILAASGDADGPSIAVHCERKALSLPKWLHCEENKQHLGLAQGAAMYDRALAERVRSAEAQSAMHLERTRSAETLLHDRDTRIRLLEKERDELQGRVRALQQDVSRQAGYIDRVLEQEYIAEQPQPTSTVDNFGGYQQGHTLVRRGPDLHSDR